MKSASVKGCGFESEQGLEDDEEDAVFPYLCWTAAVHSVSRSSSRPLPSACTCSSPVASSKGSSQPEALTVVSTRIGYGIVYSYLYNMALTFISS